MTKTQFVDRVAKRGGLLKKDAEVVLAAVFDIVSKAVREEKRFSYPGFGTFTVKERAARLGRNPRTGEAMAVKASRSVGFKAAPALRDSLVA